MIPPLLVLVTVLVIWFTRSDQLQVNHWAYPVTLAVFGLFSLLMVIAARPRRRPVPVADPARAATA